MSIITEKYDYNFRTLNYLGSKLRLLEFIKKNISDLTAGGTGVCDLFAGSGCVSYKLSELFPITSCDIQSYSKVICDALLNNYNVSDNELKAFESFLESKESHNLLNAFTPLIMLEEDSINEKRSDILSEIIEKGSLEVFSIEHGSSKIENEQESVYKALKHAGLYNADSLISRYYGGVYFSYRQAVNIDTILRGIEIFIKPENRNLFLAALLSTASDVVDTVGKHFAQPLKTRDSNGKIKNTVYNKAVKDKTINVVTLYRDWLNKYMNLPKSGFDHRTEQGDCMECLRRLPDSVRTIYADPPYTRDHYSRFYHVLETMTLRDNPEISTVKIHGEKRISNGIYRNSRYQSPFCICSKAYDAFDQMFKMVSVSERNLVLSYSPYDETKKSHPRVVTMNQLTSLAGNHFKNVRIISAGHFTHNKLNSSAHFLEASDEAEVLIVCTNN